MLCLAEQFLLGASAVVKQEYVPGRALHICGDYLVLEILCHRFEQVKLQRSLHLLLHAITNNEHTKDTLVVERAIDARFELNTGQLPSQTIKRVSDEVDGAVGVVDVSGAVVHVKKMRGLCDAGKQWVIAAGSFLLLIETDGSTRGYENQPWETICHCC